jgi:hypothetical protein
MNLYAFLLIDPARYVDAGSQMPERKRGLKSEMKTWFLFFYKGRRSLDRAISSSSTHRSNRHRRQSQHQQQQSPAPQSSVSYVANKVSFSLVNESNPPILPTTNKQNENDYELITTGDNDRHYHQPHIIPRESIDDDEEENEDIGNNNEIEDDNPIVVEQIRQQATVMISNILASAFDQISITPKD